MSLYCVTVFILNNLSGRCISRPIKEVRRRFLHVESSDIHYDVPLPSVQTLSTEVTFHNPATSRTHGSIIAQNLLVMKADFSHTVIKKIIK